MEIKWKLLVFWDYTGIVEKKMETTGIIGLIYGACIWVVPKIRVPFWFIYYIHMYMYIQVPNMIYGSGACHLILDVAEELHCKHLRGDSSNVGPEALTARCLPFGWIMLQKCLQGM